MPWIFPAARKRPNHLGVKDGKLAACPQKPNCISSQTSSAEHQVEAIPFRRSKQHTHDVLLKILGEDKRAVVRTQTADYIHAEYYAMGFVDDLEFYFSEDEQVVHIRSASRVGHSDLGANRRRYKKLLMSFTSRA